MNSILLLFISLSMIGLSVSQLEFDCENVLVSNTIHVVTPNDVISARSPVYNSLIENLVTKCNKFYNFIMINADDFNEFHSERLDFINLFVRNYDENAYDPEVVYAEDLYVQETITTRIINITNSSTNFSDEIKGCKNSTHVSKACKNIHLNDSTTQASEAPTSCRQENRCCDKDWTIDNVTTYVRVAKLMSKRVSQMDTGDLFDFVQSLGVDETEVISRKFCLNLNTRKVVLVCLDYCPDKLYSHELLFHIVSTDKCKQNIEEYKHNLLAVLAPAPFQMDYEFNVPTVFYNIPYMNPEYYSQFPNSLSLVPGKLLPYAFITFIRDLGWRRVAIISDDTPFSQEFEDIILSLFHKEGIIYNVQRCEGKICKFNEAVENLRDMQARIIIANVDEINAAVLNNAVEHNRHYQQFTLLYRVGPFRNQAAGSLSITLSPPSLPDYGLCQSWSGHKCNAVLNGINAIVNTHYDLSSNIKKEFRLFTKIIKNYVRPGCTAYVHRSLETYETINTLLISTMEMDQSGVVKKFTKYENPFKGIVFDEPVCYTKTNNFAKPCDISLILLFMFVVVIFCIIILVITCYFDNTSPIQSRRYQQL